MTILRSPLRSTLRSPLRGPLESAFGASFPLSISAPVQPFLASAQPVTDSGAIVFADSGVEAASYTVQIDITGSDGTATPTFTVKAASGATITADGSASVTIEGTLAQCLAACEVGYAIAGFTNSAWRTMTIQFTNDDTAETTSTTIILQSIIALDTGSIADSTAIGVVIEDFGADVGALHPSLTLDTDLSLSQTSRPITSNIVVTEGSTTATINLDILTPDNSTPPTDISGDLRWIATTVQGKPLEAQMALGQDSTGTTTAVDDTGFEAFTNTGHTVPEALSPAIAATGLTGSTTYYFYSYITMDSSVESQISSEVTFTTDAVAPAAGIEFMGTGGYFVTGTARQFTTNKGYLNG